MYQVVLVDDDKLVTKFLKKMIPWEKYGFEIVAIFEDGITAYEYLMENQYDVLVSDIGMPHMNGIELISKLKENQVNKYNVILTCHDEFAFAQKAIKLEAFDYILKESMVEESIIDLLKQLKHSLDESFQKEYQVKIARFLKKNKMSLKTQFIEGVINESNKRDDEWWQEQEELLDMDFSCDQYMPVLCYIDQFPAVIDRYKSNTLLQSSINNVVEEALERCGQDIQIFYLSNKFVILFSSVNGKQLQSQHMIDEALKIVQSKLSSFLKISITVVIDKIKKQREDLVLSIQMLIRNEEQRFFYSSGTIQYFEKISYDKTSIFQNYTEELQSLKTYIMNKDLEQVKVYLNEKIKTIKENKYFPKMVKDWATKLVLDIKLSHKALVNFEGENFDALTGRLLQEVENFEEMEKILIEICSQFIQHVNLIEEVSQNEDIISAKRFVRTHLSRKITLSDVATHLHFNSSYFSRMFKKETGETFVEFVTRTKIEKALELLDSTTKSVEQISLELGFSSKSYFLKTFRKHTGMAPIEYKYKKKPLVKQPYIN